MPERSELERAGGFFLVDTGKAEPVRLPELSWGSAREWSRRLAAVFGPVFAEMETEWQPGEGSPLLPLQLANERAMEAIIALVLDYDRTGVLGGPDGGGRATLEGMPARRIHSLYSTLYEEAHPFDASLQAAVLQAATLRVNAQLAALEQRMAADASRSAGASSTSSSSPNGGSPRPTSTRVSPPRKSKISGTGRTSGALAIVGGSSPEPTRRSATRSSGRTSPRASGKHRRA